MATLFLSVLCAVVILLSEGKFSYGIYNDLAGGRQMRLYEILRAKCLRMTNDKNVVKTHLSSRVRTAAILRSKTIIHARA